MLRDALNLLPDFLLLLNIGLLNRNLRLELFFGLPQREQFLIDLLKNVIFMVNIYEELLLFRTILLQQLQPLLRFRQLALQFF